MPLQPKTRFLEQDPKVLEAYLSTLGSDQFMKAAEASLLQLVVNTKPVSSDIHCAAAAWNQVEGARRFLDMLLSIAEKPVPVSREKPGYELSYTSSKPPLPKQK